MGIPTNDPTENPAICRVLVIFVIKLNNFLQFSRLNTRRPCGKPCNLQGFRLIDLTLYTIQVQVNKGGHERVNQLNKLFLIHIVPILISFALCLHVYMSNYISTYISTYIWRIKWKRRNIKQRIWDRGARSRIAQNRSRLGRKLPEKSQVLNGKSM